MCRGPREASWTAAVLPLLPRRLSATDSFDHTLRALNSDSLSPSHGERAGERGCAPLPEVTGSPLPIRLGEGLARIFHKPIGLYACTIRLPKLLSIDGNFQILLASTANSH